MRIRVAGGVKEIFDAHANGEDVTFVDGLPSRNDVEEVDIVVVGSGDDAGGDEETCSEAA